MIDLGESEKITAVLKLKISVVRGGGAPPPFKWPGGCSTPPP